MKTIKLNPNQIITLNDYPVYSDDVLNEYFNKCKLGEKVPFVPVIKKDIVKKDFDDKLLKEFEKFYGFIDCCGNGSYRNGLVDAQSPQVF